MQDGQVKTARIRKASQYPCRATRRFQAVILFLLPFTLLLSDRVRAEEPPGKFELSVRWLQREPEWSFTLQDVLAARADGREGSGPGRPRLRWKARWKDDGTLTNALLSFERPAGSLLFALHESTESFGGLFRPIKGSFGADEAKSLQVHIHRGATELLALYRSKIPNPGEDGALLGVQISRTLIPNGMTVRATQLWVDSGPVPSIRRPETDPTPYISQTVRRFTSLELHWEGRRTVRELEWGLGEVTGFDRDWDGVERTSSRAIAAGATLEYAGWSVDASWQAAQPDFASPATDDHEVKRDRRAVVLSLGSDRFDPWNGRVTRLYQSEFDGAAPEYGWELFTEYDRGRGHTRRQIGMTLEWDDGAAPQPEVELTGRYGVWEATIDREWHRDEPASTTLKVRFPVLPGFEVRTAYRWDDRLTRIELVFERPLSRPLLSRGPQPASKPPQPSYEEDREAPPAAAPVLSLRLVSKRRPSAERPYLHVEAALEWPPGPELIVRYGKWDRGHLDWYWSTPPDFELSLRQAF